MSTAVPFCAGLAILHARDFANDRPSDPKPAFAKRRKTNLKTHGVN
jgi:hypothetical protein